MAEEAAMKCGGASERDAAVARGQVKKKGLPGSELFFFPKVVARSSTEWARTEKVDREKEMTENSREKFDASLNEFIHSTGSMYTGFQVGLHACPTVMFWMVTLDINWTQTEAHVFSLCSICINLDIN